MEEYVVQLESGKFPRKETEQRTNLLLRALYNGNTVRNESRTKPNPTEKQKLARALFSKSRQRFLNISLVSRGESPETESQSTDDDSNDEVSSQTVE